RSPGTLRRLLLALLMSWLNYMSRVRAWTGQPYGPDKPYRLSGSRSILLPKQGTGRHKGQMKEHLRVFRGRFRVSVPSRQRE
ncbi:hypothetical protein, partial [Paenibacillus graminis]|uniref:hypothetical protein n=1 Tax=Paenibacillus graminis TaxID=189425 RepID=UPI001EE2AE0D